MENEKLIIFSNCLIVAFYVAAAIISAMFYISYREKKIRQYCRQKIQEAELRNKLFFGHAEFNVKVNDVMNDRNKIFLIGTFANFEIDERSIKVFRNGILQTDQAHYKIIRCVPNLDALYVDFIESCRVNDHIYITYVTRGK